MFVGFRWILIRCSVCFRSSRPATGTISINRKRSTNRWPEILEFVTRWGFTPLALPLKPWSVRFDAAFLKWSALRRAKSDDTVGLAEAIGGRVQISLKIAYYTRIQKTSD